MVFGTCTILHQKSAMELHPKTHVHLFIFTRRPRSLFLTTSKDAAPSVEMHRKIRDIFPPTSKYPIWTKATATPFRLANQWLVSDQVLQKYRLIGISPKLFCAIRNWCSERMNTSCSRGSTFGMRFISNNVSATSVLEFDKLNTLVQSTSIDA